MDTFVLILDLESNLFLSCEPLSLKILDSPTQWAGKHVILLLGSQTVDPTVWILVDKHVSALFGSQTVGLTVWILVDKHVRILF